MNAEKCGSLSRVQQLFEESWRRCVVRNGFDHVCSFDALDARRLSLLVEMLYQRVLWVNAPTSRLFTTLALRLKLPLTTWTARAFRVEEEASEYRVLERPPIRGSADAVQNKTVEEDGQQRIVGLLRGGDEEEASSFQCCGYDDFQVSVIRWRYVVFVMNIERAQYEGMGSCGVSVQGKVLQRGFTNLS
jgi:hypothetical protein